MVSEECYASAIRLRTTHLAATQAIGKGPAEFPTPAPKLQRIVSGQNKNHDLHALLPWNWHPPCTTAAA
jgi:hypothetical protein